MFPFVNIPFASNTSISDFFSGCLTCQPFGKFKRRSVDASSGKSPREIRTISSVVEKFNGHHNAVSRRQSNTSPCYYRATANCHRPCSRSASFNLDMNHEKFTPCERQSSNETDWTQSPSNSNNNNLSKGNSYGKIKYVYRKSPNWKCDDKIPEHPVVAPPRRKKRPAPRIGCDSTIRGDSCQASNLELETRKNCRNLQLNNLDQPKPRNDESKSNDNIRCKIQSRNKHNNNSECTSLSYVTNNNLMKNNKSGCSKLAVVSDSLETNNNAMQNFSKFDRFSDTFNNNNDKTLIIDNMEAGYCENKIYYKNSGFDKFGNYKHGNDADEVIICESYTKYEPIAAHPPRPPPPHLDQKAPESVDRPNNSTYTKFYTDKFYQDNLEMMSTKSLDEPFEQIVQLQPEMAPFLQSALAMLKAKTTSTTITTTISSSSKQQERPSNSVERGEIFRRCSTEEDDITDSDNSIPVVFCGLLPIHQLNSGKWMQSIRVVGATTTTTPDDMLSSEEKMNKCATSQLSTGQHSTPAKHDNKLAFDDDKRDDDDDVKVVGYVPKKVRSDRDTKLHPSDESLASPSYGMRNNVKPNVYECRYAAADHWEL